MCVSPSERGSMEQNFWIGVLSVDLHIPHSQSLKEKRRVLKSIKDRIRSRHNVSVAEVGDLDKWQRALLAVSMVSNDKVRIDGELQGVLDLVCEVDGAEVLNHQVEFI